MMKVRHMLTIAVLTAAAQASGQGMSMATKPATAPSPAAMPLIDGEILKLDPAAGLVVLKHGDIPNLGMPRMTMGFDVGDKVRFQAEMVKGKATVTELKPVK